MGDLKGDVERKIQDTPVIVFSKTTCPYCARVRARATSRCIIVAMLQCCVCVCELVLFMYVTSSWWSTHQTLYLDLVPSTLPQSPSLSFLSHLQVKKLLSKSGIDATYVELDKTGTLVSLLPNIVQDFFVAVLCTRLYPSVTCCPAMKLHRFQMVVCVLLCLIWG